MRLRDFRSGEDGFPTVLGRRDWNWIELSFCQDTRGGGTGGLVSQLESEAIGFVKHQK
jgi:hypothetical protein